MADIQISYKCVIKMVLIIQNRNIAQKLVQ